MNPINIIFNSYFSILGVFLSVILAKHLKQNGTVLKNMDQGFKNMDETLKLIAQLIVAENERT